MMTLQEVTNEKDELVKDLVAFSRAYALIHDRVIASEDDAPERYPSLRQWSGTCGALGTLELAIHSVERTIDEYKEVMKKLADEEEHKTPFKLEVIDGGSNN